MFSHFKSLPERKVAGRLQVRHRPVQFTCDAEGIGTVDADKPIAHTMTGISAKSEFLPSFRLGTPAIATRRRKGAHRRHFVKIAQGQAAFFTPPVFEIQDLAAIVALEEFHRMRFARKEVKTRSPFLDPTNVSGIGRHSHSPPSRRRRPSGVSLSAPVPRHRFDR